MKKPLMIFCVAVVFMPATAHSAVPDLNLPKKIPVEFECRWAHGEINIDGKADEKVWQDARLIDTFYLPWLKDKARLARTSTKAKLLWDRRYIYFYAELEDSDIYADVKEHDGQTWTRKMVLLK